MYDCAELVSGKKIWSGKKHHLINKTVNNSLIAKLTESISNCILKNVENYQKHSLHCWFFIFLQNCHNFDEKKI